MRFAKPIFYLTLVTTLVYFTYIVLYQSLEFWYLFPNLVLGVVTLLPIYFGKLAGFWNFTKFSTMLIDKNRITKSKFGFWALIALIILFLPNCFYLLTDFVHLDQFSSRIKLEIVMLFYFAVAGTIIGLSVLDFLYQVFSSLFTPKRANIIVLFTILACSYAVYLGRDVRLNSWDLFVRPDRLVLGLVGEMHPRRWPEAIFSTFVYTAYILPMYWSIKETRL